MFMKNIITFSDVTKVKFLREEFGLWFESSFLEDVKYSTVCYLLKFDQFQQWCRGQRTWTGGLFSSCRKDTWRSMSMSPGLKLYLLQLEKPLIGAKTHTRTRAQADSTSLWQLCWQKANSKPSALNRVLTSHRRVLQSDLSLSQTHAYTHAHACKHTRPPTDWPL